MMIIQNGHRITEEICPKCFKVDRDGDHGNVCYTYGWDFKDVAVVVFKITNNN